MFVLGFNLPYGNSVVHPDGKEERPPSVIGIGIGWSRSDFTRVMKDTDQNGARDAKRGDR